MGQQVQETRHVATQASGFLDGHAARELEKQQVCQVLGEFARGEARVVDKPGDAAVRQQSLEGSREASLPKDEG